MFEYVRYLVWAGAIAVIVFSAWRIFRVGIATKTQLENDYKNLDMIKNKYENDLAELRKEYEQKYHNAVKLEEERHRECMSKLDEILRRLENII